MDSDDQKKLLQPRKLDKKRRSKEERAERLRLKQQIRALRGVLPTKGKPDKMSVLNDAIDYMKLLQSQVRAITMRKILRDKALIVGLLYHLQHPQFAAGPSEVPVMASGTNQGMPFANGVKFYPGVPPLNASTAHHLSKASTRPCQHQLPAFPMHVTQLHHPLMHLQPGGPLPPCQFCPVMADAWTLPHLDSVVPDQEPGCEQEETSVTTEGTVDSTGSESSKF